MTGPLILYDNALDAATVAASTTAAGYDVDNLTDWRQYTWWQPSAMPATITIDCGAARSADYALIYGGDFTGITFYLECSTDNFAANVVTLREYTGVADEHVVLYFSAVSARYWRLRLAGATTPSLAILSIGSVLEMPVGFGDGYDPMGREMEGARNINANGLPVGVVEVFDRQDKRLTFNVIPWALVRDEWATAWGTIKTRPFAFSWDYDNHPDEIEVVMSGGKYSTPHTNGGYASIAIDVEGVPVDFVAHSGINRLWAWGLNSSGQVGDGSTTQRESPVLITGADWDAIDCGQLHSLGIKTDGTLWAWGDNTNGQLGDGSTTQRLSPVQIGSSLWSAISAGGLHSLGIKTDGTLWAWGLNTNGQLGDGTTSHQESPVQIGSSLWSAISAGGSHSLGIKTDGTLWAWGLNSSGQVGDGTVIQRNSPKQVGSSLWSAISAGGSYSMAIKNDATLWGFGYNTFGQLGDGSTTQRLSPVQIASNTTKVVCGNNQTLSVRTNGTLWACGDNTYGQVGDGTTTQRLSPVQIGSDSWSAVAAGHAFSAATKIQ